MKGMGRETMSENPLIPAGDAQIKSIIYTIRGKQVILDNDLARHCHVISGSTK